MYTLPHFGQTTVWADDDWEAARSFCLLRLFFAAPCLAFLPQTYDWLFSLMSASFLGLRPPAAMTDGRFPIVRAVSAANLWKTSSARHGHVFLLGAR